MNTTNQIFTRTISLIGEDSFNKLSQSTVAIIGLGGVGGATLEAVARAGVGRIILVDHDTIDISNINRQIIATTQNVGQSKAEEWQKRISIINPNCEAVVLDMFYNDETSDSLFELQPDYVVDCIDTVTSKLHLIERCVAQGIKVISSMGTGNRLDPTKFVLGQIEDTSGCGCGLARVMRRELKKRELYNIPVIFSTELPQKIVTDSSYGRHSPSSISYCPPVAGYLLASKVVQDLLS